MFSLAITNYNRTFLLFECLEKVLHDDRIDEIIIMDDCSEPEVVCSIKAQYSLYPKVKIIERPANVGMHVNKRDAVFNCTNEWVILFDSDNIIDSRYLDAIPEERDADVIYMPSFAWPKFDYSQFAGEHYALAHVKEMILESNPMWECLMNTCNYLVNREEYLMAWKFNPNILGADTIFFLYNWLSRDNTFYVMEDCQYFHRVHDGSGFMKDAAKNMADAKRISKLILDL